jgi:hypothetical protein
MHMQSCKGWDHMKTLGVIGRGTKINSQAKEWGGVN